MNNDELNEILDKRLPQLGISITPDARWKIVTLSRGLPEYVHALGRDAAIEALKMRTKKIEEMHVDAAISELLIHSNQSANTAYKKAIHSNKTNALYRQVLLACAIAKTDDEGKFTLKSLIEPLNKILKRKLEIAGFQSHVAAFCGKDRGNILERTGTPRAYKYRFRDPKMQPYVLMQGINHGDIRTDGLSILSAPEQPNLFPQELLE